MKTSSAFVPSPFSLTFIFALHLFFSPTGGAQSASTPPAGNSTATSTQDSAVAKAAERKKRFDEAKQQLENSDPRPQEQSKNSPADSTRVSPDDLSLSPILVNMLVGETQSFSLFDHAGHKLTAQAEWTINDSSTAELSMENGVPTLVSKQTGMVRVRARIDARSAEATVNVITPEEMKPGTIRWQAPSVPGFKPVQIVPAVPSSGPRPAPSSDSADRSPTSPDRNSSTQDTLQ